MSLLVLAYPQIEAGDFEWIQTFRSKHDERYYKIVNPHFTIVFPVFDVSGQDFIKHAERVSKKFKEFYFVLRCAQIVKDSFSDYSDVFLVPEEGYRIFVKLHDAMYTDLLEPQLRLDIPFIPHMGIAGYTEAAKCKKLADEINSRNIEIVGAVSKLDIVDYQKDSVRTIKEIYLKK